MAITVTAKAIVWTTTAGNKVTASFTPAANSLLVVFSLHSAVDAASTITDSLSGSWSQQGSLFSYSTAQAGTLGCYLRGAGVSGAAMTVTSAPGGTSTGGGLAVFEVTRSQGYGADPVRATGGQADQASGTPAPVLSATPDTTDAILSFIVDNTNGAANAVPRTNYTESHDQGFNTPASGIETNFRASGETSATITYGGTTPSQFGSFAIAIKETVDTAISPPTLAQTTTLFVPTIVATDNLTIVPPIQASVTTNFVAVLAEATIPGQLATTSTLFAPTINIGQTIVPPQLDTLTSAFAPVLAEATIPPVVATLTALFGPILAEATIPGIISPVTSNFIPTIVVGGGGGTDTAITFTCYRHELRGFAPNVEARQSIDRSSILPYRPQHIAGLRRRR